MSKYALILTIAAAGALGFAGGIMADKFGDNYRTIENKLIMAGIEEKKEQLKPLGDELAGSYMNAGKSKAAASDALGSILGEYYSNYALAKSAAQVSQLSDEAQIRLASLRIAIEASQLPD